MADNKNATIYDIALKCNLSSSTVSRVLGNSAHGVSEKSRAKILKAAEELNYTPNLMGKFLRTQLTNEIGVIVPEISNYDFIILSQEIQLQALELGYNIILCNSLSDSKIEAQNVNLLIQKNVRGVIMNSLGTDGKSAETLLNKNISVVLIDQYFDIKCNRVSVDYEAVANLAIDYLWKKGHRKIAFLSPPIDRTARRILLDNFVKEMKKRGVDNVSDYIFQSRFQVKQSGYQQFFRFEDGEQVVENICNLPDPPSAILCNNDITAIAIMHDLKLKGIRIPKDISIVGVDNNPFGHIIQPSLTSIDISTAQLARMATKILIDQIENSKHNNVLAYVKPSIVDRESVSFIS